jgi:hypothetical protein
MQRHFMRGPGSKPGFLFKLIVPIAAVFIVTILAMIAIVFSDPRAPIARFLDRHGNMLLTVEFVAVIVVTLLAMIFDRLRILADLRKQRSDESQNDPPGPHE